MLCASLDMLPPPLLRNPLECTRQHRLPLPHHTPMLNREIDAGHTRALEALPVTVAGEGPLTLGVHRPCYEVVLPLGPAPLRLASPDRFIALAVSRAGAGHFVSYTPQTHSQKGLITK